VVSAMESREPDITVRADVWALGININKYFFITHWVGT